MDLKVTKKELRSISLEFRTIASRLIRTDFREGMDNLRRFIDFIESNPLIYDFILKNQIVNYDMENVIKSRGYNDTFSIPHSKQEEIAFTYQLLKYSLENFSNYWGLAQGYSFGNKIQEHVDVFNRNVIVPFVQHITNYLETLMLDMGENDQKKVNIQVTGSVGQFNFGYDQSTIIATYNMVSDDIKDLLQLLDKLLDLLKNENVPPEEKEAVEDLVSVAREQLTSEKPKKGLLKVFAEKLGYVANLVNAGSALMRVIQEILQKLNSLNF